MKMLRSLIEATKHVSPTEKLFMSELTAAAEFELNALEATLAKLLVQIYIDDKAVTKTQVDDIASKFWETWSEVKTSANKL